MALCYVCDKPAKGRCGDCEQADYCSAECQKLDWDDHHELVCFSVHNPDHEKVHELIETLFEDQHHEELKQMTDMHALADLIQYASDETDLIGLFGSRRDSKYNKLSPRRETRRERRKRKLKELVPGTKAYRRKRELRKLRRREDQLMYNGW